MGPPLLLLLISISLQNFAAAELPTELDPFLEKLFDHEECEEFISSADYTNIATTKCTPLTCDFPRQVCARPASKFQDSAANTCRTVPTECLTAANGGIPVAPAPFRFTTPQPMIFPTMPNIFQTPQPPTNPNVIITAPSVTNPQSICQMPAPTGRFCGFRPMYTYNRETLQCDEFWFPGCRTQETNANLFEDYHSCQKIADLCKPTPAPTPPPFQPPQTARPRPRPPPPKKPSPTPAPSPIVDTLKSFGVGGNSAGGNGALGAIGMFTGSGLGATGQGPLGSFGPMGNAGGPGAGASAAAAGTGGNGEDLGLFGLIQQGLMGAQAAQGGKGGKEAASKAAGKILEQFTGFDLGGLGNNFGGLFGSKKFGGYRFLMFSFTVVSLFATFVDNLNKPKCHVANGAFIIFSTNTIHGSWLNALACSTFALTMSALAVHFVYRYFSVCRNQEFDQILAPSLLKNYGVLPTEIIYHGSYYYNSDSSINVQNSMITFGLNSITIICLMIILICGLKTDHEIRTRKHVSRNFEDLQRQLFRALVIQTIIPFFSMFLPASLILILPIFKITLGSLELLLMLFITTYPLIDPLIVLYIVKDYRQIIIGFWRKTIPSDQSFLLVKF
ncbi:unnamed protein product [Caenorhabditis angaria]|uniref:BPTI/Kunitz inhibitor domain-containing protein n=1 Tax=Caenorhabditis angaria TaxID=860376 RepID=A0A9P1N707_9PELO|nr:unnamed protein product [Caenorhabditis angaria]